MLKVCLVLFHWMRFSRVCIIFIEDVRCAEGIPGETTVMYARILGSTFFHCADCRLITGLML